MVRTRLRPVSNKRAAGLREYSKRRKAFLEAHPYCQWWLAEHGLEESDIINGYVLLPEGWTPVPRSTDVHHKNKRFGSRLNDERFWMAVSREGHEWIERHKNLAREKGYLLPI
jgi:hypothetical protein